MSQTLDLKTTANKKADLAMHFPPRPNNNWLFFKLTCTDPMDNQWGVVIHNCMVNIAGAHVLKGVPTEQEKVWSITRTLTHFIIHCNDVMVLNFNFETDNKAGYPDCRNIWSRESTGVAFLWSEEMYQPGFFYMRIRGKFDCI